MKEENIKTAEYNWSYGQEQIALKVCEYMHGKGLAVLMLSKEEEYWENFSDLTVNLPGYQVEPGEAFISDFCSKEKLSFIKQHGLGKILPEKGHSGYCTYAKVAFDLDKLAEFDEAGVEEFRRNHGIGKDENTIKKSKGKNKSEQER